MNKNTTIAVIVIIILVVLGIVVWNSKYPAPLAGNTVLTTVSYSCDAGKKITATYTDANVAVALSDGRTLTLSHAVSADGARYANADESIVFWSKGDSAFIQEGTVNTYDNCIAGILSTNGGQGTTFTDHGKTFSFSYPVSVTVSGGGVGYTTEWMNNNVDQTSGLILAKGTIDRSFEAKTNFSEAKFTVGTSSDPKAVSKCLISENGDVSGGNVTINGTTYAKISGNGAGAGNFYETTSYRTVHGGQCYAIEYTIHSTNIGNYDPSQGITAFDKAKVQNVLEGMVQSFKFLPVTS